MFPRSVVIWRVWLILFSFSRWSWKCRVNSFPLPFRSDDLSEELANCCTCALAKILRPRAVGCFTEFLTNSPLDFAESLS